MVWHSLKKKQRIIKNYQGMQQKLLTQESLEQF